RQAPPVRQEPRALPDTGRLAPRELQVSPVLQAILEQRVPQELQARPGTVRLASLAQLVIREPPVLLDPRARPGTVRLESLAQRAILEPPARQEPRERPDTGRLAPLELRESPALQAIREQRVPQARPGTARLASP